jgi:Domain of unknown function (DUF4082)/Bacterial Ig domain
MHGVLRPRVRGALPILAIAGVSLFITGTLVLGPLTAQSSNPIPAENQLPGNPQSEWDVSGSGDATIQGFATDISVNKGSTISFKVTTPASVTFSMNIYRLGYYQGNGARKVATLTGLAGRVQPACLTDAATGLYDCGNWTVNATWSVPATAVSGIYVAKVIRGDTQGASHIVFVVRDDAAQADILLQTDDTTWQAYNQYGGHSLYLGSPLRGYKVSYNRPFATRSQSSGYGKSNYVFYAEYPMARWLEQNGYNVKYWSGLDTDRMGTALTGAAKPKVFLTVGHDEYWSGGQRANVEAARAAGVNLMFLSGNDVFWKTRWETSIDGSGTPYRTLVAYKSTHDNAATDPVSATMWTGTWRDPRFSPPRDGGQPENALTGTIFTVNRGSAALKVPGQFAPLRFWRNSAVSQLTPAQTATLATDTIGYEWNEDLDNGSRPPGAIQLSSTVVSVPEHVMDFGSTYLPDTATHNLVAYRHSSGALVFSAGTVQWVWGLDTHHDTDSDFGSASPDLNIQQATVNTLADMGTQPATLQAPIVSASASTDTTAPASTIAAPLAGASIPAGSIVTISGTASDAGGVVGGVEVSVDGGTTWRRATGTTNWSYSWVPGVLGAATIKSRATDDSLNTESTLPSASVTIVEANCPCSLWPGNTATPRMTDSQDGAAVELGVKFQAEVGGVVNGIRFYKSAANTSTHTGHLWTSTGTLLGTLTFSGESASGWQQATFASPIPIQAGATYVVSYFTPNGHYSDDQYYFGKTGVNQWPLRGLKNGIDGPNGVFNYSASGFPAQTWFSDNYWVDVLFTPETTPPTAALTAPANGATITGTVTVSANASDNLGVAGVQFKLDGVNLGAEDTTSPYSVSWNSTLTSNGSHTLTAVARDLVGNVTTSAPIVVTLSNVDVVPPTATVTSPLNTATVSGSALLLSATATDNQGVANVQFIVDGSNYGPLLTSPPYQVTWNTTAFANNSTHTIQVRANDTANNPGTSPINTVTVLNPVAGAPAVDTVAWTDDGTAGLTVISPTFSTSTGNELVLAFVATDYSSGTNTSVTGVTGAGLTWTLVGRSNVQAGTSEIWRAFAPSPLSNVQVTATLSQSVISTIQIVSFSNVDTTGTNGSGAIGATAATNAIAGAPTATLTTTRANSWVFGIGNDFDQGIARTPGASQVMVHQALTAVGDTYWIQRTSAPIATLSSVTINDTAPTTDRYNLFICEIRANTAPDTTAPTVALTAPAAGATLSGSTTVTASASDNIGVAGVQFKLDGANLGAEVAASPYQVAWNTASASNGAHTLTAVARDAAGNTTTSAAVGVTVDNDTTPPSVSITAPAGGATVAGTASVTAAASDNVGVAGVQFKLDGANLGTEVTTAPYSVSWNTTLTANGSHVLSAVARDAAGNTTTSAGVTVTVNNVDGTPPTVSITAPAGGATVAGVVAVNASASDNVAVVGVQFKLDGVNLGAEDTAAPYTVNWNTVAGANGSHTLTAVARDGAANTTTSAAVTVTVNNDLTAPAVSVTAPANGATVSGAAVSVTASASDNVGVAGVQFLLDGANLGSEVTAAPYSVTWNTGLATNGAHTLSARARDAAGNTTTSAPVSVTVSNISTGPPVIDVSVSRDQGTASATVTSPVFSTSAGNELLLALVGTDYISGANTTVTGVSGGGLTWTLVGRTNVQSGTAEIWRAFAANPLTSVQVTATMSQAVWSSMQIVSFSNVDTSGVNGAGAIGAIASGNASFGAPSATLITTRDNSWVFGVGSDFDAAISRTVGANQTLVHQFLSPSGDTYWMQRTTNAIPTSGTSVTINDTAPTSDRYNLFIAEIRTSNTPDTIAPTVSLTAPADGATVSGSVAVSASASDNVGVSGVQFKLDGVNLGAEDTASPYSVSWNTLTAANGAHALTAVARDAAGNTTTSSVVTVTVSNDTTAPAVSITAPAAASTVADTVSATADASDNVGVAGVQFKLDGANLGAEDTASPYSVSWNTLTASNGAHTLTAIARDAAGNTTTSATVSVTVNNVDGTAPTVSITAPAGGATVTGTVSVAATAADNVGVAGVQFMLDGANLGAEDTAAPYSVSWNTLTASNGAHTLTAIARDAAGNTTTAAAVSVTVSNDTAAPTVSVTAPAAGSTVADTLSVTATAADDIGVVGVQFKLDGANLGAEVTAAPYAVSWNTTLTTNGAHVLSATARDAAGNSTTSATVPVTVNNVDGTAPTVSITAPAGGATVLGSVTVTANAADNVGVLGVQFKLDGVNLGAEDTAAPYSVSWNTLAGANGSHTLTAVARDGAGNTATAADVIVTVNNDLTAPTVSMTAPAGGATVSGSAVTVSASASDNVGVAGVQFLLDGAALGAELTTAPYSMAWNTLPVSNGAHTVAARARDAAGNITTSPTVSVTVSNVASPSPVVDVTLSRLQNTKSKTVAVTGITTTQPNELLLAFIATDQLGATPATVQSIAGGTLTWTLVKRQNEQNGTAEIWRAFAPAPVSNLTVTATLVQSVTSLMTVVSFSNVDTTGVNGAGAIGAIGGLSKPAGAPIATLTTTRANSLVFGVGIDYDGAVARTIGAGQSMVAQLLATVGDTYWVQRLDGAVATVGTVVTINDTAPTADRFNLAICEIRPPS